MAIIGCSIARNPGKIGVDKETYDDKGEEESWYHIDIGDKITLFLAFFILFAYTAKSNTSSEGQPTIMVQSPYHGHGVLTHTFLLMLGIAGIFLLVKKFPLVEMARGISKLPNIQRSFIQ